MSACADQTLQELSVEPLNSLPTIPEHLSNTNVEEGET